MIGDDIESLVTKRTRRAGEETVYGYEADTKQQVRRLSLWVRSGHEAVVLNV